MRTIFLARNDANMTGTRRKPRYWNTDMKQVDADEVIYHDYTDEHCTDLCMIKFKTTLDRVPLWVEAHRSAFKDAVWETEFHNSAEVPARTFMLKTEIDGKSLTIKFCESSGIIAAQGPQGASRWKNSYLQDLKTAVNSLEALRNQSSFEMDVTESQPLTSQRCANESITAISPIAKTDAIAQARNSFVSVVSDSNDRIARSKRRDARSRNIASSFLGEVDWPSSTEKGPMKLSRSLPVLHRRTQTEEEPDEPEERVEAEAPLITSTPIGVRHLQREPFVPSTPSLASTRYLSTLGEADDTIQERSLTEQQEVETAPTTPINTQERSPTTQETASSPSTAPDVTVSPMERNLSQEPPTVASETFTFTHPNPPPQIPDVRFPPPYSAIVEREAFEKDTSEKLNQLTALVLDLQIQLNTRDKVAAQQMELVTTLLKAQMELHCPSPTPEADDDKHLLIGSSLIQLVDESQLKNTEVICMRGAHPNRLSRVLKAKAKAGEKFESVSLLVGGNKLNRSNPISNISATADAIMETAECAKAISKKVRIVELPPRLTNDAMIGAIQGLNREVQDRCSANEYEFVPTSGYFWLANGTPNRALIDPKDKVHPTELGAEMLLLSIGVQLSNPDDPRKGVKPKEMYPPPPPKQSTNENTAPIPPKGQKPKRQRKGKGKDRAPNPKAPSGPKQQGGPPMGGQTRFFSHASQNTWQNPPKSAAAAARKRGRAPPHMTHTPERSPPHMNHTPERSSPPAWSPNGRSAGAHMQGPWGRSTPTPQGSAWSTQERSPAERCQLCLNVGHSAPACRSQSQPCYRCGKPGHFSRACPY